MNECKIVEDLLPLYAEDLVSPETKEYVERHCEGCEGCENLRQRSVTDIPGTAEDPKAYKKAMRKNIFNLACKLMLLFILTLMIGVCALEKLEYHVNWMEGKEPVEQVVKAPVGNGEVTIVDWEASGWKIGGVENVGTVLWMRTMDVREEENGTRYSFGLSGATEPWENVQIYWAPNGIPFLATADLLEGGTGIYIHAHKSWYDEDGGHHSTSQFLPSTAGNGLVDVLAAHCKKIADFPTGWETITFTFLTWREDSETLVFVYETDNGHRGVLDYHFPTDTITRVN